MPGVSARIAVRTAAGAAWAAEILTCSLYSHPSPLHELMGVSTIVLSVWAIAERFGGKRLRPGERIIGDSELHELEAAITRAVTAGYRQGDGKSSPQGIRAMSSR